MVPDTQIQSAERRCCRGGNLEDWCFAQHNGVRMNKVGQILAWHLEAAIMGPRIHKGDAKLLVSASASYESADSHQPQRNHCRMSSLFATLDFVSYPSHRYSLFFSCDMPAASPRSFSKVNSMHESETARHCVCDFCRMYVSSELRCGLFS